MKKHHHITSLTILFVIGFLFVHSELDFFTPEQHAHNTHDFCDIVDNAKPENSSIERFKINSIDVPIIFFSVPLSTFCNNCLSIINNSKKPFPDINLNVLYSSFLI